MKIKNTGKGNKKEKEKGKITSYHAKIEGKMVDIFEIYAWKHVVGPYWKSLNEVVSGGVYINNCDSDGGPLNLLLAN